MGTGHAFHHGDWINIISLVVTGFFACITWRVSKSANRLAEGQEKNETRRFHIELFKNIAEQTNKEFSIIREKYEEAMLAARSESYAQFFTEEEIRDKNFIALDNLIKARDSFIEFYDKVHLSVNRMFEVNEPEASLHVLPWFWFYLSPEIRHELLTGECISNLYRALNSRSIALDQKHPQKPSRVSENRCKFSKEIFSKHLFMRNNFLPVAKEYYSVSTSSGFMEYDVKELEQATSQISG